MMPKLIDARTGQYMQDTLKRCHDFRVTTYSFAFNIGIIVFFLTITCIGLYICFTKKKTPAEEKETMLRDQRIILEKIRSLKEQKQNYYQEESMTQLPFTGNNDYQ
jgi:hypothetical protein